MAYNEETFNKFLDSLEDLGLIKQEENKDILQVNIKVEKFKKPIVEVVYELNLEEE